MADTTTTRHNPLMNDYTREFDFAYRATVRDDHQVGFSNHPVTMNIAGETRREAGHAEVLHVIPVGPHGWVRE
jgi:hypothetical protein